MVKKLWLLALVPILVLAGDSSVSQGTKPWQVDASARVTGVTVETIVTTTSATIPGTALPGRRAIEVQNLGPNDIFCALNTTAVVNKSRKVAASGGVWSIDITSQIGVNCIAATANQATGAATIVTEVR